MTRPDWLAALIAYLKADDDVIPQVGDRVFGVEIPPSETDSMPRKCVVIVPSGGVSSNDYLRLGDQSINVICFGKTYLEAMAVHLVVSESLKQMERNVTNDCLFHNLRVVGGSVAQRDIDTNWPFVLSTWMLKASEYQV